VFFDSSSTKKQNEMFRKNKTENKAVADDRVVIKFRDASRNLSYGEAQILKHAARMEYIRSRTEEDIEYDYSILP